MGHILQLQYSSFIIIVILAFFHVLLGNAQSLSGYYEVSKVRLTISGLPPFTYFQDFATAKATLACPSLKHPLLLHKLIMKNHPGIFSTLTCTPNTYLCPTRDTDNIASLPDPPLEVLHPSTMTTFAASLPLYQRPMRQGQRLAFNTPMSSQIDFPTFYGSVAIDPHRRVAN